jgi:hypothetical protein
VVGQATGGHHSIHGGQTKKNPCNKRRKGATGDGTADTGTADLTISDWLATPYHRVDPPSPTLDMANPNPNRSGSASQPQISLVDNQVIHDPITHLNLDPTGRCPPGHNHRCASFRLDGVASPILPLGTERWEGVGVRKTVGRSLEWHGWRWWWVD